MSTRSDVEDRVGVLSPTNRKCGCCEVQFHYLSEAIVHEELMITEVIQVEHYAEGLHIEYRAIVR